MFGFERFTEHTRNVLTLALSEALEANSVYVSTEHLLLGLLVEAEGLGGRTLAALGVTVDAVRAQLAGMNDRTEPHEVRPGVHLPPSDHARQAVEAAFAAAQAAGQQFVGTQHLLVGLLTVDGIAGQVLRKMGAGEEAVRTALGRLLTEGGEDPGGPPRTGRPHAMQILDDEVAILIGAAQDVSELDGAPAVGARHLLLVMAEPGTSVAATIGAADALRHAATRLLPIARAYGEAVAAVEDAVERGDRETAIRHRADRERLREEFQGAAVNWRAGRRPDGGS